MKSGINTKVSVPPKKIPATPSENPVGKAAGSPIKGFSGTGTKGGKIKA